MSKYYPSLLLFALLLIIGAGVIAMNRPDLPHIAKYDKDGNKIGEVSTDACGETGHCDLNATATIPQIPVATTSNPEVVIESDAADAPLLRFQLTGLIINVLSIKEDSRCPANANCVWQGTFRINVELEGKNGQKVKTVLTLNEPYIFDGKVITLQGIRPQAFYDVIIKPADYRYDFKVDDAK